MKTIPKETVEKEIELIKQGMPVKDIAKITGTRYATLLYRCRAIYKLDPYTCFKEKIEKEGPPSRLNVTDAFGYWFSGIFDGEGTISALIRKHQRTPGWAEGLKYFTLAIKLGLRDDDKPTMEYIQSNLCGTLYSTPRRGTSNPSIKWSVHNVKDLTEIIIPLFDKYPLKTKKGREYIPWRSLVISRYCETLGGSVRHGLDHSLTVNAFQEARAKIDDIRKYKPQSTSSLASGSQ